MLLKQQFKSTKATDLQVINSIVYYTNRGAKRGMFPEQASRVAAYLIESSHLKNELRSSI